MFEDSNEPQSESRCEALEYKVWVRLADGSPRTIGNVMTQNHVMKGEGCSRTVGEMGERERGGDPAMLVQEDHIRQSTCLRRLYQVWKDQVSTIETDRCWKQEADLFCEAGEASRWVAGGCNQYSGVNDTR